MKLFTASLPLFFLFAAAPLVGQAQTAGAPDAPEITIIHAGPQTALAAPPEHFTGTVSVAPLFPAKAPARTSGGSVTFQPGARSAWHTHPFGQALIVTVGTGWVQREGGPIQEMRAGDVVRIPPNVKHWHGATATTSVTHIAIQEELDGKNVNWLEKVSDQQYLMKPTTEPNTTDTKQPNAGSRKVSPADVRSVAPALDSYTDERLYGEVWERPGLSKRDRSVVTVAALIARNQTGTRSCSTRMLGMKTNSIAALARARTAIRANAVRQPNRSEINVPMGMPKIVAATTPVPTMDTALPARSGPMMRIPVSLASDQKTGSPRAGRKRATAMTAMFGDSAATTLDPAKSRRTTTKSVLRS